MTLLQKCLIAAVIFFLVAVVLTSGEKPIFGSRTSDNFFNILNNVIKPNNIEESFGLNMAPPVGLTVATSSDIGSLATSTYYFKVVAIGSNGTTSPSAETSILVTPAVASTTVVYWTAKTGASYYRLYIGTTSGAENMYYSTSGTAYTITTTSAAISHIPSNDSTAYSAFVSASSSSYFLGSKLGIATSTPVYNLDVAGTTRMATTTVGKFCIWNGTSYTILTFTNTSTSTNNFVTSTTCN